MWSIVLVALLVALVNIDGLFLDDRLTKLLYVQEEQETEEFMEAKEEIYEERSNKKSPSDEDAMSLLKDIYRS